jgi:hypothetical protein
VGKGTSFLARYWGALVLGGMFVYLLLAKVLERASFSASPGQ